MRVCVLLSGGMDSALALHWALGKGWDVFALSIDYGQRHRVELAAARRIAAKAGVELVERRIEIPWQDSSLTGEGGSPVVPGRNLILATLAAAEVQARGGDAVMIACVSNDADVFPDCRPAFLEALSETLMLAVGVQVIAPFAEMTKREAVAAASQAALEAVALSWSCYDPQSRGARAPGPCEECSACIARMEALS